MGTNIDWKAARKRFAEMTDEEVRAIVATIPKSHWEWTDFDTWFHYTWAPARRLYNVLNLSLAISDPLKSVVDEDVPKSPIEMSPSPFGGSDRPSTPSWFQYRPICKPESSEATSDNFGYRMAA